MANNIMNSSNSRLAKNQQLMEFMKESTIDENVTMLANIKDSLLTSNAETNQEFQRFCIIFILQLTERYQSKTISEKKVIRSVAEIFKILFEKTIVDDELIFFSTYRFLINEIFDTNTSKTKHIDEDYKLLIIQSMTALMNSLTDKVVMQMYIRDSIFSLSPMILVTCEFIRYEKFITLRRSAIECLLSISKIKCLESENIPMMKKIADVQRFILPGALSALASAITEGETCNHNVTVLALQAFGKLLSLHLQDYNDDVQSSFIPEVCEEEEKSFIPKTKWKNMDEAKKFVRNNKCTMTWFRETDLRVHEIVSKFVKLTCHSHDVVREELIKAFLNVVDKCSKTLPKTICKVFEICIILQEDKKPEIKFLSQKMLQKFSFNSSQLILAENLEENFFDCISSLTRIFNGFDEQQQLSALNLLIGYMKLFGSNHLLNILQCNIHLSHLMQTLLHITQIEQKNVHLVEEYLIQDLELRSDSRTPWKNFYYFREQSVQKKLEMVFETFAFCGVQENILDILTDIFHKCDENRKEATLILNSLMLGIARYSNAEDNMEFLTSALKLYMDPEYWDLQLQVDKGILLHNVQKNLIQICLQIEGIGVIASVMKEKFKQFLFKCMFPILIHAGSGHPLLKAAGISAITSVAIACGYAEVSELLIDNSDYFSFHVIRRMRSSDPDENILNVLSVMIKYSNLNTVPYIAHIIREAILSPHSKFRDHNINAYLRVINIFIKSLQKCLNIEIHIEPIKSKLQRKIEYEEFKISNIDNDNCDIEGQTVEEMYQEDMKKARHEMEEDYHDKLNDPYQEMELPLPQQLTAELVELCLNFLPSKDQQRQILVIDILIGAFEILRDFENTVLPLVHKVWSPLRDRFSENTDMLIMNLSFQLFVTLARISKDFIRARSMGYVIPRLSDFLKKQSKCSHLQDVHAPYRCTKGFKLQLLILQQFGRVLTDIEASDSCINSVMESIVLYLHKKQPMPLQEAAKQFFVDVAKYDQELVKSMLGTQNGEEIKINAIAVLTNL